MDSSALSGFLRRHSQGTGRRAGVGSRTRTASRRRCRPILSSKGRLGRAVRRSAPAATGRERPKPSAAEEPARRAREEEAAVSLGDPARPTALAQVPGACVPTQPFRQF